MEPTTAQTPKFNPQKMISFDLETTGINPLEAKIVTSAIITIDGSERQDKELLADPGVEIPKAASDVHGITTEKAQAEGRPHDEVLAETISDIYSQWEQGATLIVYNAAYDLSILKALDPDFTVRGLVVDPFVIDQEMDKFRKGKRTLSATAEHYNVPLDNAHEATADAVAAARVAWQLAQKYPQLAEMSGDEFMMAQARWFENKQRDLEKWRRETGRQSTDQNFAWPIHQDLLA